MLSNRLDLVKYPFNPQRKLSKGPHKKQRGHGTELGTKIPQALRPSLGSGDSGKPPVLRVQDAASGLLAPGAPGRSVLQEGWMQTSYGPWEHTRLLDCLS